MSDKMKKVVENEPNSDELTIKQRLFCENYVQLLNGTRAAIVAGYGTAGAAVEASRMLRNPKIKAYIEKLFTAAKMGKSEVIGRLEALANADIGNYLEAIKVIRNGVEVEEWRFNLVKAIKDGNTSLIKSIKRDRYGVVVELHDKVRTLELIGKHHRLFADITIAGDKPDNTATDLDDATLAEIAASAHNVNDPVDTFAEEDARSEAASDVQDADSATPGDATDE